MGGHPRDTKVIFGDEKTKMLATILSTSLAALVSGSALPHPEMPPAQERGECMAWSWSSATGWKCTQELNTDPVNVDKFRQDSLTAHNTYRAKHGVAALKLNAELNAPSNTGQTTTLVRTSTCPAEGPPRIKHREPSTAGTLRSRITLLDKNQAGVDQSLATSPRW